MMLFLRRRLWPALAVLALLSIEVAAAAQAPAFRWWKSDTFKKELGLSADQSARIDTIYQDTLPELRQEWEELDRLEAKLSRLFEGNADEAVLARQIDRVETARANLNKSRSLMLMRMRRVLTSEQLVRFRALSQRYEPNARSQGSPPHPIAPPSSGARR